MRHAVDGEREEREKLARYRKALYKTARAHGVIARQDFAVFENNGYQGLYHETAANGFHVALANELLTTQPVAGKDQADATHHRAGAAVRKTMEDMGVPTPEQLPTSAKSIQQVRHELSRQRRVEVVDRLGLWARIGENDAADGDAGE